MEKVAIVGSGTMGQGIAQVLAMHAITVNLVDVDDLQLQQAESNILHALDKLVDRKITDESKRSEAMALIHYHTDLKQALKFTELVIEAVSEDQNIKKALFARLDEYAPRGVIIASNTSSISITDLAGTTSRPEKVIGMHFMNPVPVMKLVEIVTTRSTSVQTIETITKLAIEIDKTPVVVKDRPGFVSNRILMPMINEAIHCLQEGVAGIEQIDTIMKLGMSHPMGPLQLADYIGLDVCLAIMSILQEGLKDPKYAPAALLTRMVNSGQYGRKTGKGFYDWTQGHRNIRPSEMP